jgi:hypothetical protein
MDQAQNKYKTHMKRIIALSLIIIPIIVIITMITVGVIGTLQYQRNVSNVFSLSSKSPNINERIKYLDMYIDNLEHLGFSGDHNAIWNKHQNNSFDANLQILQDLRARYFTIENELNHQSLEYQTAIIQIDAWISENNIGSVLYVMSGIWWKNNYILLWDRIPAMIVIGCIVTFIIGCIAVNRINYY